MVSMRKDIFVISIAGLFFLLLHLVALFSPADFLWGVDHWGYFPVPVILLLGFAGLVICFFPLFKNYSIPDLKIEIFSGKPYYFIIPAFSFFPFFLLRQKSFFLGDGYIWLRNLESNVQYRVQEPLEVFLHSAFYNFTSKYFHFTPELSWALVSVFCGMLFVFAAMLIANYAGKTDMKKLMLFLGILSIGTIQLFFGYVETYSAATLLILFLFIVH